MVNYFFRFPIAPRMKDTDYYAGLVNLLDHYAALLKLLNHYVGLVKLLDQNTCLVKNLEHPMDPVSKNILVIWKDRGTTSVNMFVLY